MDNQELNGSVNMSSTEPHVTVDCPICGKQFMKKVEFKKQLTIPCCMLQYEMTDTGNGNVRIEIKLTAEQIQKFYNQH